jgi:hypothetical protein
MKTRVTAKWVRQNFTTIYSASYSALCDLQSALPDPAYYTCGVYGWNADVFILDTNTVVVAGYRPFGNVKVDTKQLAEILLERGKQLPSNRAWLELLMKQD